jgi:hypothetical protein
LFPVCGNNCELDRAGQLSVAAPAGRSAAVPNRAGKAAPNRAARGRQAGAERDRGDEEERRGPGEEAEAGAERVVTERRLKELGHEEDRAEEEP